MPRKYAPEVTESGQDAPAGDDFSPVLEGAGASDYERYLRTDRLLELQSPPEARAHRDELLFQTALQASELWLKLCWQELEEAVRLLERAELAASIRLLRRASLCLQLLTAALDALEQISPWDYQDVRKLLGPGGFDSPGVRELRRIAPQLGKAFDAQLREQSLSVVELYVRAREYEQLYQLAEGLVEFDLRLALWRHRGLELSARMIGEELDGQAGWPQQKLYPELWRARRRLTELAREED